MSLGKNIIEAQSTNAPSNPFRLALRKGQEEKKEAEGFQAYADEGDKQVEAQYRLSLEISAKINTTLQELSTLSRDTQFSPDAFVAKVRGIISIIQKESHTSGKLIDKEHQPILEITKKEAAELIPIINRALQNVDISKPSLAVEQLFAISETLDLLDDFHLDLTPALSALEGKKQVLKIEDPVAFQIIEKVREQRDFVYLYDHIPAVGAQSRNMRVFLATEVTPFMATLFDRSSDAYRLLEKESRVLENIYGAEVQREVEVDPVQVKQDNRAVVELFQKIIAYHTVYDRLQTSRSPEELAYLQSEQGRDIIVRQFVMGELSKFKRRLSGDELIEVTKSTVTRALILLKKQSEISNPVAEVNQLRPLTPLERLKKASGFVFRGMGH